MQLCSCACQMPAHDVCCWLLAFLRAGRGLGRPSQAGATETTVLVVSFRCLVERCWIPQWVCALCQLRFLINPFSSVSVVLFGRMFYSPPLIPLIHRFETIRFPLLKASTVFFFLEHNIKMSSKTLFQPWNYLYSENLKVFKTDKNVPCDSILGFVIFIFKCIV